MSAQASPLHFEVRILGQRIVLRAADKDPALVKEIVDLVSEKITAAELRGKSTAAAHQVTLLALLDLAEQYVNAKRASQDFQKLVEKKTDHLLTLIEAELK